MQGFRFFDVGGDEVDLISFQYCSHCITGCILVSMIIVNYKYK